MMSIISPGLVSEVSWKAISLSPMIPIVYTMSIDHASEGRRYLCDTFETKPEVQVWWFIPVMQRRGNSEVYYTAIVPSVMYV